MFLQVFFCCYSLSFYLNSGKCFYINLIQVSAKFSFFSLLKILIGFKFIYVFKLLAFLLYQPGNVPGYGEGEN